MSFACAGAGRQYLTASGARSTRCLLAPTGTFLKRSAQAPLAETRIQNAQSSATMTELVCHAPVSYWCCFTKFPFGSTSNSESLPFAFTDTS
jgi:hypothetical protein